MVAIAKRLESSHKTSLLQREHFKATHDPVTGLLNQIALNERIEQEIALGTRYSKSFAILMVELDQFRDAAINHSKSVSNHLLMDFAKRLKGCVRSTDTLARLESDMFLVLLPDINNHRNVVKVVENINQHLLDPISINDAQYHVRANIGVSLFPDDGYASKMLIERAHVALFQNRGNMLRNYGFYDEEVDHQVVRAIDFENRVREAIEQHTYDVHYRPIKNLADNHLSFVEAETIWHDSALREETEQDIDACIDALEMSKLFGDVQLNGICQQLAGWKDDMEFSNTPVFIALTDAQFEDAQLVKRYEAIIDKHAIAPELIGFIIKEHNILQDTDLAARQIGGLKQLGCRIMIDEFSCGLSYVGKLTLSAIDLLRLNGELIKRMDEQIEWLCIVEGVIRIGKQLGVSTIINSVDNSYQYQTLLNINGDYWQGEYAYLMHERDLDIADDRGSV